MEKPTMKQRLNSVGKFLWDSENGKILGRGGRSWAEIGIFYLVYYACLTAFFAATMAIFYQTIETDEPKLQSDSSLLKGNPGMGFRPRPDIGSSSLIAKKIQGKNKDYVSSMKKFLEPYNKTDVDRVDCTGIDEPRTKAGDKACIFDLASVSQACSESTDFGFADGKPCIVIKMNKVFGWVPKLWGNVNDSKLPDDVKSVYLNNVVPVKCYAKKDKDADSLGDIEYYPQQGFPSHFFPYKKQKDYVPPLVFAKFANFKEGESVEVECRTYAKNIKYDKTEKEGSTQFKVTVNA